ncbi:MAG: pilin [Candidatus Gracilibacteria bacterium]|nr:pilin [Candidatus Gracilibacteria bacterium]
MPKTLKKFYFSSFACLSFFASTAPALAALKPDPEDCPPNIICDDTTDIQEIASNFINWILGFVGLIAVIMFIYAGFLYLTAGGNDENTGKAKKIMMYTIIGIILIMLAYTIVAALTGALDTIGEGGNP